MPAALVPLKRRPFINCESAIKGCTVPAFAGRASKVSFYSSTLFLYCLNREIEEENASIVANIYKPSFELKQKKKGQGLHPAPAG